MMGDAFQAGRANPREREGGPGDEEAFASIARGSADRLFAVAHRILRDVGRAEDAVLEVGKPLGVSGAGFAFSIFDKVSVDPCHAATGFQTSLGPTVDDLAAAFTKVRGINATTPTDVTFGGQRGKQLTISAPSTFGECSTSGEGYFLWELPLGGRYFMEPGERNTIRILDVGGQRMVVDTPEPANATAAQRATVREVLDTVRLEPIS
jgi:hypothetical protein